MAAEFFDADQLVLGQIDRRCRDAFTDRWQMIASRMAASFVVPVGPNSQDVIQVLLADDAKAVQDLVLERLNDAFDERLQIR